MIVAVNPQFTLALEGKVIANDLDRGVCYIQIIGIYKDKHPALSDLVWIAGDQLCIQHKRIVKYEVIYSAEEWEELLSVVDRMHSIEEYWKAVRHTRVNFDPEVIIYEATANLFEEYPSIMD
jgi:hypothetical protein